MARFALPAGVLIPREVAVVLQALLKTKGADLDALRIEVRGRWPMLDEVLAAWQAEVLQYGTAMNRTASASRRKLLPEQAEAPACLSRKWMGTAEAARLAGCTDRAVRLAAAEGRLHHEVVNGKRRFDPAEIAAWRAARSA